MAVELLNGAQTVTNSTLIRGLLEVSGSARPDTQERLVYLAEVLSDITMMPNRPDLWDEWPAARQEGAYVFNEDDLNRLLHDYPTVQQLCSEFGRWKLRERLVKQPVFTDDGQIVIKDRPEIELFAVREILDWHRSGQLERLRRCVGCDNWFFARRLDKQTCSHACRQRLLARTHDFKRHRRAYMKWRYQRQFDQTRLSFQQWLNKQEREDARYGTKKKRS